MAEVVVMDILMPDHSPPTLVYGITQTGWSWTKLSVLVIAHGRKCATRHEYNKLKNELKHIVG